ncbi:hypothetical protein O181_127604 [Austropuccinia psidii MF-1]|uniref:Uncharacterized protein n=1 Tax=Austropuccinia psidii MF-1 TaxID=1389203 RepID=A0A9Q3KYC4_9BASI|nr:hypothetical protein [Austropuccinia psidii MF-1]
MEDWGEWQPPCISTGIEPSNINFGLRQTKQRMEREERNKSQSLNIAESLPVQSKEVIKKKVSFPGGYIEEEDTEEGERAIIPSKYKEAKEPNIIKEPEAKPVQQPILEVIKEKTPVKKQESEIFLSKLTHKDSAPRKSLIKEEDGDLIIEKVMKKVLDQKIHLTMEEILTISPSFTDQLKFLSEKEKYLMSMQSINNQEQLVTPEEVIIDKKMHYACQPVTQNQSTSMTAKYHKPMV